ncbi:MAG: sigma-70 family RNA polymerase sigma factor [Deltaproteobacteria bacterium]|nr:sigma-70 family RNA polymerase sigma factor [Deltaproteobacteria bacterium]
MNEVSLRVVPAQVRHVWPELELAQIHRALGGDREAFGELFRCYAPAVRHAVAARVARMPGIRIELDELVQSVWLQLLREPRRLRNYDPEQAPFGAFIRVAAAQVAWRLVRRRSRTPTVVYEDLSEQGDTGTMERQLRARGDLERLWELVAPQLNATELELFDAVLVQGRKIKDVAAEVGKNDAAVYKQCDRMRLKLITIAKQLLDERGGTNERGGANGTVARLAPVLSAALWLQTLIPAP